MLSLTEFETAFQTCQFRLSLKISSRLKVRFLGEFCHLLTKRDNPVLNQSYYQEILPHMEDNLSAESLAFQPVAHVRAIYLTLRQIKQTFTFGTRNEAFESCYATVKQQLFTSHIYLCEFTRAAQIVFENEADDVALEKFSQITSFDDFCTELKRQECPEVVLEYCSELTESIHAETTGYSGNKVWIPLVEKLEETVGTDHYVGTIYPLHLELEPRQNNNMSDIITFHNHPLDHDDLVNYQAQDAFEAARNQHSFLSKSSSTRYTVSFGFPSMSYSLSGSSFGFGMALLALCSFECEANLRAQHAVSNSTAITGGIDLNGNIRTVSGPGLREKISAAYYSPLTSILVPSHNMSEAQAIVRELDEMHPLKKFKLIGEMSLAGVMDNNQVLHHKNIPLNKWLKIHLTRFRVVQIITIMLIAVGLTIGVARLTFDNNPSDFAVEGESVLVFNKSGDFLWSVELGHTPEYLNAYDAQKPIYRRLQIHDFDGDGQNEVIFGTAIKQHEFNGHLSLLESDGTVKWKYVDHPVLSFGGAEYTNNYGVGFIYPFTHANSATHDFYVRFSHMPWFPNRIVRFDVEGNILNEFVNPGAIYDMEMFDIDLDGEFEMILGCTSNAFNSAAVAIMPSRSFSGTTPRWENSRQLDGAEVDSSLIYIKFPHWGEYDMTGTGARTHVNDIHLNSSKGFIVSVVLGGSTETGSYLYDFDWDLNLLGLSVSDGLLGKYHKLTGGDFFTDFDQNEWRRKMTQLDIWRDGKWSRTSLE
jgi:hypothetical protein